VIEARVAILANADDADAASTARANGAKGVGLCRSEHQFLGARIELVRAAVLAESVADEARALGELVATQVGDHRALLDAVDGASVTVRLLDPPMHELLPPLTELAVREASGQLADGEAAVVAAARRWHEHNPMLGVRGVRLAQVRPALYQAQASAIGRALDEHRGAGGASSVSVLLPMVSTAQEFVQVRQLVRTTLEAEIGARLADQVRIGAMIETPRACFVAGELARVADFVSIGTNDLTQLTLGLSRDDTAELVAGYLADGVLAEDPFVHLDDEGVGALIRLAVSEVHKVRPDMTVSVCGEHAGDPASIEVLVAAGVDALSCSPLRVRTARLAAARAVLSCSERW
jgi:pyruvate, orthophosphate dikinase